jgi:hypothetical protein
LKSNITAEQLAAAHAHAVASQTIDPVTQQRLDERRRRELERQALSAEVKDSPGPAQFYRVVTADAVKKPKRR